MKTNKTKRAGRSKRRSLKRKQRGGVKKKLDDDSVVEADVIRQNKVIGDGKRTYTDGSVYEGPFDGLNPHGQGKMTMSDGHVYVGWFSGGVINGRGVMTDPKGNAIECEFITLLKNGIEFALAYGPGTGRYKNGTVYEGEFIEGKFNGHGTLTMTDGSVFEGNFRNGVVDGVGRLTHADGTFEEGNFRHINGELVHLDIPDVVVLQPPWSRKRYEVERAIAEKASA
jgi:hypothetical protein